jgi:hypothetical protein
MSLSLEAPLDLERSDVHATLESAREDDGTLDLREQGVVTATPDVLAGVEVCAVLANDNRSGADGLAGEALHAKPLRARIATVLRGAETLLVCHLLSPCPYSFSAASGAISTTSAGFSVGLSVFFLGAAFFLGGASALATSVILTRVSCWR